MEVEEMQVDGSGATIPYPHNKSDWKKRKAFIGLYSSEERKKLFIEYFEKDVSGEGSVRSTQTSIQNPYDERSWYSTNDLNYVTSQMPHILPHNDVSMRFFDRYTRVEEIHTHNQSATNPSLYNIDNIADYFKHILYERGDLFMKVVPLFWIEGDDENDEDRYIIHSLDTDNLKEIYNEIIIGYFLNELVYGYSNVLSIHFMTIVDWFIATKDAVLPDEQYLQPYHQIIISEKMDISVYDYLKKKYKLPTVKMLRAILFQIFHALETAWYTNQYTHNDLHANNVMLKEVPDDSPLNDIDFVYRRLSHKHWYRIDRTAIKNMVVKIIDFGRNRMYCPSQEDHINKHDLQHTHDRLICTDGMEHYGYPCYASNRQIDVRLILLGILEFWPTVAANNKKENQSLYDMCERMIDFKRINKLVREYHKGRYPGDEHININKLTDEWRAVNYNITAGNYFQCPTVQTLLRMTGTYDYKGVLHKGVFVYRYDEDDGDANASDVLNDAFFDSYRMDSLVPDYGITQDEIYSVKDRHAVVSFITHPSEAVMLSSSVGGGGSLRCSVCNASDVTHVAGDDDPLCGKACYEFKYLFNSKTVYR